MIKNLLKVEKSSGTTLNSLWICEKNTAKKLDRRRWVMLLLCSFSTILCAKVTFFFIFPFFLPVHITLLLMLLLFLNANEPWKKNFKLLDINKTATTTERRLMFPLLLLIFRHTWCSCIVVVVSHSTVVFIYTHYTFDIIIWNWDMSRAGYLRIVLLLLKCDFLLSKYNNLLFADLVTPSKVEQVGFESVESCELLLLPACRVSLTIKSRNLFKRL